MKITSIGTMISADPIVIEFENAEKASEEFYITYDVQMDDGTALPTEITPAAIFGKTQTVTIAGGSYSFDVLIPFGYTAKVYRYAGDDKLELTGPRLDIEDAAIRSRYVVNNGYDLGTEPVYARSHEADLTQGPATYSRRASFSEQEIYLSRKIIVQLSKRTAPVYFNARWALSQENLRGRGSSGFLNQPGGSMWPNILTDDTWNWNSTGACFAVEPENLSGDLLTKYNSHWQYDEETDSYNLDWVFQTNQGEFILNNWEINGYNMDVPFIPEEVWEGNTLISSVGEGAEGTYTTMVVDEAVLHLRQLRIFNNRTQRVYHFTITGARNNMTLTGGNLMAGMGAAPEINFNKIVGVSATDADDTTFQMYYGNEWNTEVSGNLLTDGFMGTFNGDPDLYYANLRFRLLDGYENPVVILKNMMRNQIMDSNQNANGDFDTDKFIAWNKAEEHLNEGKLQQNYLYGPDNEGFYYMRLYNKPGQGSIEEKLYGFKIIAANMRYIVRYMVGTILDPICNTPGRVVRGIFIPYDIENTPFFDPKRNSWDDINSKLNYIDFNLIERYDDNNGRFYDPLLNYNISIVDNIPIDPTGEKEFQKWILVDSNENPIYENEQTIDFFPNTVLRLHDYLKYISALDTELGGMEDNYLVLRIKAVWKNKR